MLPISPIITKRSITETTSSCIIDLCSPIHKDVCRNSTPLLTNAGTSLHENEVDHVGQHLFPDCDEEDEYWEPEEYRNITANNLLNSDNVESQNCTPLANNQARSEYQSKASNDIEEVIDLCSPISVKIITSPKEVISEINHDDFDDENSLFDLTQEYSNNTTEIATQQSNNIIQTSSQTISHTGDSFSCLEVTERSSQSLFRQVMTAASSSDLNGMNNTATLSKSSSYSGKALHQMFRAAEAHVLSKQATTVSHTTTRHSTTSSALLTAAAASTNPAPYKPSTTDTTSTSSTAPPAAFNRTCSLFSKPVAPQEISTAILASSSTAQRTAKARSRAPPLHRSRSLTTNATTTSSVISRSISVNSNMQSTYTSKNSNSSSSSSSTTNSEPMNNTTTTPPPLESVFRSRYGEKTLQSLPALPPSSQWEVVLLIDKRERSNALIQSSMAASSVPCQLATLAVGDFLWIIRPKSILPNTGTLYPSNNSTNSIQNKENTLLCSAVTSENEYCQDTGNTIEETTQSSVPQLEVEEEEMNLLNSNTVYILDCIAERKSINDLVSSFGDGRYMEQKNRLKACNLRSTMYIVEGDQIVVSLHQKAISATHVKTAMVSIHVSY